MAVDHDGRVVAGRYRLTREIGRGGMGIVWAAVDRRLGREVAVKELRLSSTMSDEQRRTLFQRAMREGRIAATLEHRGVVTVYDTFMADDRPWIVMELLRGRSLAQTVSGSGPLAPERAAQMGRPLLGALRAAHDAGILHRDVKPGNVLLADVGRVLLTDFGLAAIEGDPSLTQVGMVMGSPPYVAPERARGAAATPAADLWALGATLFMAVEGRGPYDRDTPIAALGALVTEEPPEARHAGPLRPLIEGLLTRDPAHRLDAETAAELLRRVAERDHSPHAAVGRHTDHARSAPTIPVPTTSPISTPNAAAVSRPTTPTPTPTPTAAVPGAASGGTGHAPGGHARPDGPGSADGDGASRPRRTGWIGRHRAPVKLTAFTAAVALAATTVTWHVARDRERAAPPSRPTPATTGGHTHPPRSPAGRHTGHHTGLSPAYGHSDPAADRRTQRHRARVKTARPHARTARPKATSTGGTRGAVPVPGVRQGRSKGTGQGGGRSDREGGGQGNAHDNGSGQSQQRPVPAEARSSGPVH